MELSRAGMEWIHAGMESNHEYVLCISLQAVRGELSQYVSDVTVTEHLIQ